MGRGWCLLSRLCTDLGSLWAALINLSPALGYSEQGGQAGSQNHEVCARRGSHVLVGSAALPPGPLAVLMPSKRGSPELRNGSFYVKGCEKRVPGP